MRWRRVCWDGDEGGVEVGGGGQGGEEATADTYRWGWEWRVEEGGREWRRDDGMDGIEMRDEDG